MSIYPGEKPYNGQITEREHQLLTLIPQITEVLRDVLDDADNCGWGDYYTISDSSFQALFNLKCKIQETQNERICGLSITTAPYYQCVVTGHMSCEGHTLEGAKATGWTYALRRGREGADRRLSVKQFEEIVNSEERLEVPND